MARKVPLSVRTVVRSSAHARTFNVPGKIVQNGLPPLTLLLDRIFCFSVERDAHGCTVSARQKLDRCGTVSERILNQLVRHDPGIRSGKVEPEATVFSLHAG